jgi:voltage-gated potassium channel
MADSARTDDVQQVERERWALLAQVNQFTETPMVWLSFAWLGLLVLDFTQGLSPLLQNLVLVIWGMFILDFAIEFAIAPHRGRYLRQNWLTAVSLVIPALRILRVFQAFRILRAARATRSIGLLRLLTSTRRGLRALGATLQRRGFGYVVGGTILVIFVGAAGMIQFEGPAAARQAGHPDAGIADFGEALWWTAMILTTMGSDYWPVTAEGRILTLLLSLYAFSVFGYITATLASHFVSQDAEEKRRPSSTRRRRSATRASGKSRRAS